MAILVYFTDETGAELEYSGYAFAWCGGYANDGSKANRTQIEVTRGRKRYMLTANSFAAQRVNVKVWAPRGSEYWALVPGETQSIHDLPTEWIVHPSKQTKSIPDYALSYLVDCAERDAAPSPADYAGWRMVDTSTEVSQ
jgi:hypothetical protein